MKTITLILVFTLVLTACGGGASTTPTPNVPATVDAAVKATDAAQQSVAAPVEAAVTATSAAAPTVTPAPTPLPPPPPTATPIASDQVVTMTEEELAALIDEAVNEAVTATTATTGATQSVTYDDTITQDEVDALEEYLAATLAAIEQATALIEAYYNLYGELAEETLAALQAIEQDLNALAQDMAEIAATFDQIDAALQQGLALAQETIDQLEAAAQTVSAQAQAAQTKAQAWVASLATELENRAAQMLSVAPTEVARDRVGAIQSAFAYVETVRASLADSSVSRDELSNIAQTGANAVASLQSRGGAELQGLAGSINALTAQIARGQVPQAKVSLGHLERSLPPKPSLP